MRGLGAPRLTREGGTRAPDLAIAIGWGSLEVKVELELAGAREFIQTIVGGGRLWAKSELR